MSDETSLSHDRGKDIAAGLLVLAESVDRLRQSLALQKGIQTTPHPMDVRFLDLRTLIDQKA